MLRVEHVSEAPRIATAGTRVRCSNFACSAVVAVLVKEIRDFRAVAGKDFASDVGTDALQFAPGQRHVPGEPAVCRKCHSPYLVRERSVARGEELFLHTDIGWIPRLPMSAGGSPPPDWGAIETLTR